MIGNFLIEFVGSTRRLTAAILLLLFAIYISGFIIVNAYLWKFGIAQLEFLHPTFVAAGLFFILIGIVSGLVVLPFIVLVISPLLNLAHVFYLGEQNGKGRQILYWRKQLLRLPPSFERVWLLLAGICIALATLIFAAGIPFLESRTGGFVARVLDLASGAPLFSLAEVESSIGTIMILHGVAASFILLLLNHRRSLGTVALSMLIAFAGLAFLFVQTYSLLKVAGDLYEQLPPLFGGGRPLQVILVVEKKDQQWLKELGIRFDESATSVNTTTSPSSLLKTEKMLLIWQANSGAPDAQTDSISTYIVRPCDTCPAIEIRKSLVHAMIHIQAEGMIEDRQEGE